jgi:YHS domain-containing protein
MLVIRRFGWSALVLAALAGCGNQAQESTTKVGPSETAPYPASPSPESPPPTTSSAETSPGTDKGTTSPGNTNELPKVEGPTIEAPTPSPATKEELKKSNETKAGGTTTGAKVASVSLSDEEVAEIKKLPGGEAERAIQQAVCPVSGENLGSMGVPVKVMAEGQTFYLCCKSCNKDVRDDPKAVVAKLRQ